MLYPLATSYLIAFCRLSFDRESQFFFVKVLELQTIFVSFDYDVGSDHLEDT